MCVWEWLIGQWDSEEKISDDEQKIRPLFENYGWSAMRSVAMQAGKIVASLYDYVSAEPTLQYIAEESFDWEFTPMMCAQLDWDKLTDNNQYGKADWRPDPKEFLAVVIAKRALHYHVPA